MVALLFSGAIVAAPLVLLHGPAPISDAAARPAPGAGSELVGYHADRSAPYFPPGGTAPTTTSTAAAPPPPTTAPPPPTTTIAPPPTTTTAPPPPTTTAAPTVPVAGADGSTSGEATWYSEAPPGGCASPTLPFGTEVEVDDTANGASTSCVVDDREASNPGRVLDMSYSGFSSIADPTQGVVTVTLTW